jgi:hypothetical protein
MTLKNKFLKIKKFPPLEKNVSSQSTDPCMSKEKNMKRIVFNFPNDYKKELR